MLMLIVHEWAPMSNVADGIFSLELVHNHIHMHIGGDGHMGAPEVSGFDPIFFFHHTNVSTAFMYTRDHELTGE